MQHCITHPINFTFKKDRIGTSVCRNIQNAGYEISRFTFKPRIEDNFQNKVKQEIFFESGLLRVNI